MQGINEVKKKTKLSLNEIFDNQLFRKLDNQKKSKLEDKQTTQLNVQKEIKQANQPFSQSFIKKTDLLAMHKSSPKTIQLAEKTEQHLNPQPDFQPIRQVSPFPIPKQQTQKVPT